MTRIEEVGRRLADVVVELAGLPSGPSPERFALLREQDALRAEAREWEASDDGRAKESFEAELAALRRSRRVRVGGPTVSPQDRAPVRKYVGISPLPLMSITPLGSNSNVPDSRDLTTSLQWMRPASPLDSIRLAVLTVSPHRS